MPTLLMDENIDGYADYLARFVFSSAWHDVSTSLDVRIVTFADVQLANGSSDEEVWEFCQQRQFLGAGRLYLP